MSIQDLIDSAFERLNKLPGFVERADQKQLALLLSDCIEEGSTGAFEAPTGLGKSLAALIPAIAHAIVAGKRTVVATYTNVLAEQYWRNDLPLAMELFAEPIASQSTSPDGRSGRTDPDHRTAQPPDRLPQTPQHLNTVTPVRTEFLIGRQRYACLAAMQELDDRALNEFRAMAELGIESEFREYVNRPARDLTKLWQAVSAPPVCPSRMCPHYRECFYYSSRRKAEQAHIVITNHSVVLQDALLRRASEGEMSMLGDYDFLIIDEAHDFPQAAQGALEFELSESKLNLIGGLASKIEQTLMPLAIEAGEAPSWTETCHDFKAATERAAKSVKAYGLTMGGPGILAAAPEEVWQHPQVKTRASEDGLYSAKELAGEVAGETHGFVSKAQSSLERWKSEGGISSARADEASELIHNYSMYLREFGQGCQSLFTPSGVAVSYAGGMEGSTILRNDVVGLAAPLSELLWKDASWACMSATLALDGNFDFFRRTTGAGPAFEEILPTPFDYASQAAVYLPPRGAIPDPADARKMRTEDAYFAAVAKELGEIIEAVGGRTLALFHSRREMEAVRLLMDLPDHFPILMQKTYGTATVGERFLKETNSSLFALRSFWTGFDAPGETLSCVALVRVPFEVPIDPPAVARMAWLQTIGLNGFSAHTLPVAKMLMRQGAGRLIRRADDKGIIALLDPRLQTKGYGEEIIANLPRGIRTFRDIGSAAAHVGIEVNVPHRLSR